jgi:multicomponent K+:H+ antiporter subunit A
LQPQLQLLMVAAFLAGVTPFYMRGIGPWSAAPTIDPVFGLIWTVGVVCAVAAAYQSKFHRLAALILLGGVGLMICISFVWLSAPDLALTQLVVETVTTVLLLLGLRWLPKRLPNFASSAASARTIRWYRIRDLTIAVAAGAGLATLAYMVMTRPMPESISAFFVKNAYTQGGGTNIVNVILVDFRAFDTFGEITVLGIVAIIIYALLRRFRPAADSIAVPEQQQAQSETDQSAMAVPALLMTLLFPVIGVVAVFMFLRGHDQPGGGFVAGVTMAVAFILQFMARGTAWTEDRLRVLPTRWMGVGLLIAGLVGSAASLFGRPFLSTSFFYLDVPWIGAVPVASALLFDLGVFSLVVGATVLMLIAIAHQSLRSHRAPGYRAPAASAKAGVR